MGKGSQEESTVVALAKDPLYMRVFNRAHSPTQDRIQRTNLSANGVGLKPFPEEIRNK